MSLTGFPEENSSSKESSSKSVLQKLQLLLLLAIVVAMAYAAWTFYSRHQDNLKAQQELEAKQQARSKRALEQVFGSGELRVNTFLAYNHFLKRGEKTQLCYGVANATAVKLDPPVEATKPSYRHCLDISPERTTTYTLTAFDASGHSKSATLEVRVN